MAPSDASACTLFIGVDLDLTRDCVRSERFPFGNSAGLGQRKKLSALGTSIPVGKRN